MNTIYFLNQVMGNLFHTKESPTLPEKYYIGLSASAPTTDGGCSGEPSREGTGYARVELNSLSEPDKGVIKNEAPISFNESLTSWGTMLYYIVYDAETGGNLLFFGNLSISRNVEPNTIITIKTGELSIALEPPAAEG